MKPARALIDRSSETVLVVCPLCTWRLVGTQEATVRRGLLHHLSNVHNDTSHRLCGTQQRWFDRKGITA